jgi:hypothetical protein
MSLMGLMIFIRMIRLGEQYERVTLCSDNGWSHFNTCLVCKEIRECFCCTFHFGHRSMRAFKMMCKT